MAFKFILIFLFRINCKIKPIINTVYTKHILMVDIIVEYRSLSHQAWDPIIITILESPALRSFVSLCNTVSLCNNSGTPGTNCRSSWPGTHRDPPVFAFQMMD